MCLHVNSPLEVIKYIVYSVIYFVKIFKLKFADLIVLVCYKVLYLIFESENTRDVTAQLVVEIL